MTKFKIMIAMIATTLWAGGASAQQIGVVGLYQNGTAIDVSAAAELGCTMQRSGSIFTMGGNLSTPLTEPDQFVVLACEQSVMADIGRRMALSSLSDNGDVIALFEGDLTNFKEPASAQNASTRQYILKLGYYNNTDVDGRNAGLMALDKMASQRDGTWTTESFLQVHSAAGIATPDEVVILYYDNPEIAGNFREANPDILEEISAFNDAHLNEFTYLFGAVTE